MKGRMTDKGLVIGFTCHDLAPEPEAEKVPFVEAPSFPAEEAEVDEAPVVEADTVDPAEAPRRRGRPRKYID